MKIQDCTHYNPLEPETFDWDNADSIIGSKLGIEFATIIHKEMRGPTSARLLSPGLRHALRSLAQVCNCA